MTNPEITPEIVRKALMLPHLMAWHNQATAWPRGWKEQLALQDQVAADVREIVQGRWPEIAQKPVDGQPENG